MAPFHSTLVMRERWEAAQAGLRVFLEEDGEYVQFLERLNQDLACKLRFKCRQLGESVVEAVTFDRFVEAAEQLRYLHAFFQAKLKLILEDRLSVDGQSADERCSDVVGVLGDMLCVLRVVYKQLFCRSEATQAVLKAVLMRESADRNVIERYLTMQQLTPEKLVGRPLKRFDALVEFVEALSKALSVEGKDDSTTNGSDGAKVNYAPQLMHIAQENKHFIYLAKADVEAESELIALQTKFRGDGAEAFIDLSDNKLLLHGEVLLLVRRQSDPSEVGLSAKGWLTEPDEIYAHIFQDGTLVCSKRQESESGDLFTILQCLHLKQDATFLEHIPTSVPILESTDEDRALALILQDTTLVFAWDDATEKQRWVDAIGGFLEMNGSRLEVLHQGRAISNIPIPEEITNQLVETDIIPTEFPSFYDDHLPGVFWMVPSKDSKPTTTPCELVEIVFYARWLLVFKLNGWARHSSLCHFDTCAPEMEIGEQPRGDKEWSLVISNGAENRVTLVSKKRTRIDFWFDQVWKSIDSAQTAARRAEREKREREEMEQEEAHACGDTRRRGGHIGKKRTFKIISNSGETSADEKQQPSIRQSPTESNTSKPDDKTDEECGEQIRGTSVTITEEEPTIDAAAPAKKKSRRLAEKSKQPSTSSSAATIASPPMKTPKRRWLTRKSEDPNDTTLLPTQPSPTVPTDESTSEIDATQIPANESANEEQKTQELRIILTGIEPTAAIRKKIDSIAGAVYEEDIEKATHILAPKNQLKRTVKLLCGISRCTHILDVRWLDESARVGAPVYERAHCLKDAKAEAKWHFDLLKTMYDVTLEQRQQLFAGLQVFITNHKSVLPPVKDLAKIVECAGGIAVTKGSAGPNDVVITSDAALTTASVRKTLTQANPQKIYSPELVLSSILQQHIHFDKNHLEQSGGGGSRRRR
ncbi:PAX-interacting protein 1 [Phytophthora citrophthora]|uniref:PAX-interacting protein 1 n=1 Tax=Phytophthora citrophthora TaxID=4793 RepID=A0AAD9LPX6_9STRA|nr:PAX-interacting protein 1 [Phytophthora citrophthora]